MSPGRRRHKVAKDTVYSTRSLQLCQASSKMCPHFCDEKTEMAYGKNISSDRAASPCFHLKICPYLLGEIHLYHSEEQTEGQSSEWWVQKRPRWRWWRQSPSWGSAWARSAAVGLPGPSPHWWWPGSWWWHSRSHRWRTARCDRPYTPNSRTRSSALPLSDGSYWQTAGRPQTSWASGRPCWPTVCVPR